MGAEKEELNEGKLDRRKWGGKKEEKDEIR